MGDFNLPDMDWTYCSAPSNNIYDMFIDFINEFGLSQFVHKPTRISDSNNGHLLDLLISNVHDAFLKLMSKLLSPQVITV
jgi:hypothetical protein